MPFFFVKVTLYKFDDETFNFFFTFCFFTNLRTGNEIESVKTIYNYIN